MKNYKQLDEVFSEEKAKEILDSKDYGIYHFIDEYKIEHYKNNYFFLYQDMMHRVGAPAYFSKTKREITIEYYLNGRAFNNSGPSHIRKHRILKDRGDIYYRLHDVSFKKQNYFLIML